MAETIHLGDMNIAVTRKEVKNVHLSVHPPDGRVTLVAPQTTRLEVARAYAASKVGWIRAQQARLRSQARETARQYVERESHYLWGRRYLLSVVEKNGKPEVRLSHRRITLSVRPGSSATKREAVMQDWQRSLLHKAVPGLIRKWEARLGVQVAGYFLQRMKTKWGACNCKAQTIRLNTELVQKPKHLLEYVVVHELLHLVEPRHNKRFMELLDVHYPHWREARQELNELPLSHHGWT
ncbi:MAG: M48 family metallopeptidase [Bacteroidota bacterium]|jgi:predicted metal-dependent hydrolase